jgi:hypothetical protein
MARTAWFAISLTASLLALCASSAGASGPRPDHVVVVVMENRDYGQVIGVSSAPYINALAAQGASFTASYAVSRGSEPNYRALFSGSTQGAVAGLCPQTFSAENLGHELAVAGLSFAGFSESMPSDGFTGCASGNYTRTHNPWVDFTNVAPGANLTFADFPSDYSKLPTVSFVVPNLCDDMHDCAVNTGDGWLQANLDGYVQWAKSHNSLLVLTWDEDGNTGGNNQIPTIIVGAGVSPGTYGEPINHYSVLRTLEDMYGLPHTGEAANVAPISDVWSASTGPLPPVVTGPPVLAVPAAPPAPVPPAAGGTGGKGGGARQRSHVRLALVDLSVRTLARTRRLVVRVVVDQGCTVSLSGSVSFPPSGRKHRTTFAVARQRLFFVHAGMRTVMLPASRVLLRALRGRRNAQIALSATCRTSSNLTSRAALRSELH